MRMRNLLRYARKSSTRIKNRHDLLKKKVFKVGGNINVGKIQLCRTCNRWYIRGNLASFNASCILQLNCNMFSL